MYTNCLQMALLDSESVFKRSKYVRVVNRTNFKVPGPSQPWNRDIRGLHIPSPPLHIRIPLTPKNVPIIKWFPKCQKMTSLEADALSLHRSLIFQKDKNWDVYLQVVQKCPKKQKRNPSQIQDTKLSCIPITSLMNDF